MRLAAALALVLSLAAGAAACHGGGSATTDQGSGSGTSAGSGVGVAHDAGPTPHVAFLSPDIRSLPEPKIQLPRQESARLLAPGASPRIRLRYHWVPRASHEVTATAKLRSRRLVDGKWTDATEVPPVREGFGFIIQPSHGADKLSFRGLIAAVVGSPDDAARARADEYLSRFRGLLEHRRGTGVLDDRGQLGAVVFADDAPGQPSEHAADELHQRWLAAAVPLPAEPVGKGARWRVVTVLRAGAAVIKQTAEYTLVEVRPDRWVIDEDVRRIGERQLVDAPQMPNGTIAELIALFRESKGRVEVSPDVPWPVAGTLTTELRIHARFGLPGSGVHEDITEDTGTITFHGK